jgi:hypothetical protein
MFAETDLNPVQHSNSTNEDWQLKCVIQSEMTQDSLLMKFLKRQ